MGAWADLPTEILTNILQALDPTFNENETPLTMDRALAHMDGGLLSCMYVSRQTRAIAEILLYRNVYIPPKWRTGHPSHGLIQFTRAIALRPELGQYVHNLTIPSLEGDFDGNIEALMDGSDVAYDDDEVSQSLSSFGEAVASDLQPILRVLPTYGVNNGLVARGGPSGILITLLHLLPRLRILAVNAGNELEHIAKSCFGCFAGGVPAGLKSLSTLSLWWYRMGGGFRVSAVVPFLALQSLEDLTIGTLGEQLKETNGSTLAQLDLGITISPDLDLAAQQPLGGRVGKPTFIKTSAGHALLRKSSPVTRLSILSSMAPGYIVNQILSLPSNLEKFHYEVADNRNDYDPLSRADILPGLKNQAPSLKEFTLHAEPFDWLEIADRGPFLKTLPEFVALEKLSISARLLLISASYRGSGDIDAARHRLDGLLPTDLISLELDLNDIDLPMFLAQTRIPQSLVYTLQSIPSLKNLTLKGRESFDTELSVEVAHQIQSLQLQLKGSICGVDYGE